MKKDRKESFIKGETGQVPLYRSYGVTKRVRPFVIFLNVLLTKIIFITVIFFQLCIIAICAAAMFFLGGVLISTLMTVIMVWVFLSVNTRVLRRRLSFVRRFKRFCKKNGLEPRFTRGFFAALSSSEHGEVDIVLEAFGRTYFVKYVTPRKPLSSVTFLSKDQARYTKHARRNIFTLILDLKDKSRVWDIGFPAEAEVGERIVLVNPNPRDIYVKNAEGATVPTGSGEKIYGYTIYTGTGFLDELAREKEKDENA